MHKKVFSYVTIAATLFTACFNIAAMPTAMGNNLSIVVSSCDKYVQFWTPFFTLLQQNWPELNTAHKDVKIYLIANSQKFPSPRVETINIPNEKSWSDNMLEALDKINTKYVLLFLDDYWINARVNQARFNELFNLMQQEDAAYLQLFIDTQEQDLNNPVKNVAGVVYKNKFQKYRASLQLALWETKALKQILRSGESAWDFEMAASIRSSGYPKEFLTLKADTPITHLNAAHQSHITREALALAKELDPNYVTSLPVLRKHNWRLRVKHLKHRANSLVALVKRNVFAKNDESYRYEFQERK